MSEKIAMLGGTFNPIHNAHVKLALEFADRMKLDKVLMVPTAIPPHKEIKDFVPAEERFYMTKLVCDMYDKLEPCGLELERKGKSYTVDTLKSIKELYPDAELYLIVGADMFLSLETWRNPQEIFKMAKILSAPREDSDYEPMKEHQKVLKELGADTFVLEKSIFTVSSTEIREKIKGGEDVSSLIPEKIYSYIKEKGLYL